MINQNYTKKRAVLSLAGLVLLSLVVSVAYQKVATRRSPYQAGISNQKNYQKSRTPGKVERNLGVESVQFGSTGQAQAMLQLLNDVPGKTDYLITYQTAIDVVFFGVDFDKKTISRMHSRPDGTGNAEQWSGYVLSRLESAAGGGSLNDTPKGKLPGTSQYFRP